MLINVKNTLLNYISEKKKLLTWENIMKYLKKIIKDDINSDKVKIEALVRKVNDYIDTSKYSLKK